MRDQQEVVAGKNYFHRNYSAFLRGMGIRLSQATSDLQILLGFECQVMAATDTTLFSISVNCFLYRGSQSYSHEIKYSAVRSKKTHKISSSFHFWVKVYHSLKFFCFFSRCVIAPLERCKGGVRIDLQGVVSRSGFVSVFWRDEGLTDNKGNFQLTQHQRVSS